MLRGSYGKVEKVRELLGQVKDISKELGNEEDLAGSEDEQEDEEEDEEEDEQEQHSQAIPLAYGFQGRDGYTANQWTWLEQDGGY